MPFTWFKGICVFFLLRTSCTTYPVFSLHTIFQKHNWLSWQSLTSENWLLNQGKWQLKITVMIFISKQRSSYCSNMNNGPVYMVLREGLMLQLIIGPCSHSDCHLGEWWYLVTRLHSFTSTEVFEGLKKGHQKSC